MKTTHSSVQNISLVSIKFLLIAGCNSGGFVFIIYISELCVYLFSHSRDLKRIRVVFLFQFSNKRKTIVISECKKHPW